MVYHVVWLTFSHTRASGVAGGGFKNKCDEYARIIEGANATAV